MTVGELRKALEGLPDDMPVEATYDGGYAADGVDVRLNEGRRPIGFCHAGECPVALREDGGRHSGDCTCPRSSGQALRCLVIEVDS
jgi:hypothetical protein